MAISTIGTDGLASSSVTSAKLASGAPSRSQLPAGTVLQVVQTALTTPFTGALSSAWGDITGLSASITPTSSTSKILVIASLGQAYGSNDSGVRLVRGSTPIGVGDTAGTRTSVSMGNFNSVSGAGVPGHFSYLDSPATTSSTTYKVQFWTLSGATFYLNEQSSDSDLVYRLRGASTITLMEIAA